MDNIISTKTSLEDDSLVLDFSLIEVINGKVNARGLWEFLEIKKDFSDWIKNQIERLDLEQGIDYHLEGELSQSQKSGMKKPIEYFFGLDIAKEVAMISLTDNGKKARKYFIEAEKKLTSFKNNLLLTDLSRVEILRMALESEEARIKLEEQNKRLIHASKVYTTGELAKELNIKSAMKLNKLLEEHKIQYCANKTWLLYSKYADKGYTDIKQTELDNGKIVYDRRWTGLGRDFLIDLVPKLTKSEN